MGSQHNGFEKKSMRSLGYGFRSSRAAGASSQQQTPSSSTRNPFDDNSQLLIDLEAASDSGGSSPALVPDTPKPKLYVFSSFVAIVTSRSK
jgi:hypothetical protein